MEDDKYLRWICKNLAKVWDEKEGLTKQNIIGILILFQNVFPYNDHKEEIWNIYDYLDTAIKVIKADRKYK